MPVDEKGIFPSWMDEDDIITQLVNQIINRGGKVPYTFVINPEQSYATRQRMKIILDIMINEELIRPSSQNYDGLELGLYAGVAARVGFKKYKRLKRWKKVRERLYVIGRILFIPVILAICALLILLFLHFFNRR